LGQLLPAPEGRAEYERSLSISRRDDDVEGIGAALRGLAEYIAVEEPDRLAEAHRALDEALAIARRSGNLEEMVRASLSRATIEWRRGPRDRAVADGLATLDGIDALRDLQPEEAARSGIVSRWLPAYRGLAGFLLASDSGVPGPDGLALAFAVQERMRARVLREALDAALRAEDGAQPRPPSPADERIAATRAQIAGVQRLLIDPALSGAARQAALSRLEQLEIDEAALRRDASGGLAAGAAAPGPTRAAAIEEVRRALPADTALLAYQVAPRAHLRDLPGGAWLVVVTAGRARAYPLPEPSSLASTIGMFTGLIERRDGREGPAAARLYHDLLEPALGDLPSTVTHLVFVLDGILHAVPFAVLRPAPDADPLAARYDLTAAPSATLWLRFREAAARPATIPAIAYADPDLGAPVNGRNEAVATVGASRAWAFGLGARLGAMPRARAEGRSLVDRLGGGSRLLAGKEASERSVKSGDLGRFAIVHFAAHAVLDDEHPERSSLVLAPGDPGEDGLLQPREVVDLELGGRLVVLSSCRSASGAILAGEGVMGLARAFFRAGARTVVGSLWSLRDADAADLFEQFYERIGRGESVAGALAGAQRDLRSRGRPAAAWAGLVVLGDGSAVPVPAGTAHPAGPAWLSWAAAALAGAIIVATALLLVRRARAGG
ncbi:MAG TPA: CHAT domain-containing protein, partial [Candidatus Polarisedimenticolia bacterium]|nr:CHAT domain-containing protein [Candidatus Polarisedimenticolia bacterium]